MTVLPLLATLAALSCGPLLYAFARTRPAVLAFLDGFVLVSIAGLVLLEVLPGAYGEGGAWSLGFLALGAIGPSLVEHGLHHARRKAHLATLALAILGLLLHSIGDGVALAPGHGGDHAHHAHDALAIAVIVHSVPVGLVVWWVMAPVFGPRWPAVTLALMCAGTVAGYVFGLELNEVIGERAFAWFQALVAGSILHVVFGRPHLEEDSEHRDAPPPYEGLGNLVALAGLFALDRLDPHAPGLYAFLENYACLGLYLAPWVLLAYLLLGGISAAVESARVRPGAVLRKGLVEWVDRSAILVLIGLAALSLWLGRSALDPVPELLLGKVFHGLCAGVLAAALLLSLLRSGGRRWVTQAFGSGHAHRH